jgi:hypothetical protein
VEARTDLGRAFAQAIAAKDFAAVGSLLHPEVDFAGMTPSRFWTATGPEQVVGEVLRHSFDEHDVIEYLTERDGRIDWLRMLCSGFRPA